MAIRSLSLLIFAIASVLYFQSLSFDFAYDDALQIIYNPLISSSDPSLNSYLALFFNPTPPGNLYRPVTLLSYKLTFDLAGLVPFYYHLSNLILYALLCYLVYHFYQPLFRTTSLTFIATLLFTVHPIHVEAVANVIGRAELLSALFGVFCCLVLRKAVLSNQLRHTFLASILLLIALLSKESALVFLVLSPAWVLVAERQRIQGSIGRLIPHFAFLLLPALLSLIPRSLALQERFILKSDGVTVFTENPIFHMPFAERLVPAIKVLGDYFLLMFAPLNLSADYSMTPERLLSQTYSVASIPSFVILLFILLYLLKAKSLEGKLLLFWSLFAFILTANILTPIGTIMGERLAFVSSIGFVGFVCLAFYNMFTGSRRKPALIALTLLCLSFALGSLRRMPIWKNNGSLFAQTLVDSPYSPKAKYNAASYLYQYQKTHVKEIKTLLEQALKLDPTHILSLRLMTELAIDANNYQEIEFYLRRLLKLRPNDHDVQERLDTLLANKEKAALNETSNTL